MATGKVAIDGEVVDSGEARVSVFDRSVLYGDSVFEVYRTYGGVPFAETEHLERLARSAARLMIPMPVSLETLSSEVRATLARDRSTELRPVDGQQSASGHHRGPGVGSSGRTLRAGRHGLLARSFAPDR